MQFRSRIGFIMVAGLVAGGALAATDARPAKPAVKMHSALQIKPGLWEFYDTARVTGDTVFPDAVLARVPAAQRARRLAELRQMISQPSRERECISQATFEQRVFGIQTGCSRTVASNRPGRLEIVTKCRDGSGGFEQSKSGKILATSGTSVTTSFHAVSSQAGKTMTVDSLERGQWVGSSCGNIHGIQQL
jgi:hypothetical protein